MAALTFQETALLAALKGKAREAGYDTLRITTSSDGVVAHGFPRIVRDGKPRTRMYQICVDLHLHGWARDGGNSVLMYAFSEPHNLLYNIAAKRGTLSNTPVGASWHTYYTAEWDLGA